MKKHLLNAEGLSCPLPLLKAKQALSAIEAGDRLTVTATDAGSFRDIPAFISQTSHSLIKHDESDGTYRFLIQKGVPSAS